MTVFVVDISSSLSFFLDQTHTRPPCNVFYDTNTYIQTQSEYCLCDDELFFHNTLTTNCYTCKNILHTQLKQYSQINAHYLIIHFRLRR